MNMSHRSLTIKKNEQNKNKYLNQAQTQGNKTDERDVEYLK